MPPGTRTSTEAAAEVVAIRDPVRARRGGGRPTADIKMAADAARTFLEALGVDCDLPGTVDSPARMARAYAELLSPRPFQLTTFPNDERYDEMVVVRSIPVQ